MWRKDDGSVAVVTNDLIRITPAGAQTQIIPLRNTNAKRIGEMLHGQGFRKVA